MTDEPVSLSPSAPLPPTEADYEAIAAAVMGTVRGRWFLAEFAKRNRNADSGLILERIDRIEKLLHAPPAVSPAERVRIDLVEMAKAIARTRSEIAAIKPDGDAKGTLSEASQELGSIVKTTERATSDILAAAEQVQEIAWTLRERGADGAICDALDQRATDVYSACSFQDLTGQRIRKVVDVLGFLEDRIRAMIEIWGGAVPDEDGASSAVVAPHVGEDRTVPHLEQQDIDRMMPSAPPDPPAADAKGSAHGVAAAAGVRGGGHWAAREPTVVAMPAAASGAAGAIAAAEPVTRAEALMAPAMAVVGATALALDLWPIETARRPEPAPEPEPEAVIDAEPEAQVEVEAEAEALVEAEPEARVEAEPEAQVEAEPQAETRAEPEAEVQAKAEPEPQPEPQPEPEPQSEPAAATEAEPAEVAHPALPAQGMLDTPDIEADAAASEPRADPAAVLKRILAIIRAPNEAVAASPAPQDALAGSVAAAAVEPDAPPEAEAAATAAAVSILAPTVAEIAPADGSGSDVLAVDLVAVSDMPATGVASQPAEATEVDAPKGIVDEPAAVPAPVVGRLTVDQAVDAMLKAPGRFDAGARDEPAGLAPPVEAPTAGASTAAEPVADEAEPAAAPAPFVLEVPEFTVAPRAPAPSAEPAPVAETAAAIAQPSDPEPHGISAEFGAAAPGQPAARADEPPVVPLTRAPSPPVIAAPPPPDPASEAPPPVAPAAAAPAEPARPAPRHPALAAITALSDEEKIALFS